MFGSTPAFAAKPFPHPAINFEDLLAPFFVEGRAAHPFLHVVGSPIGILDDGHHHIVVLRDQCVARRYVDLSLIDLRARLIETLFDIVQIEDDIVRRRFTDDANDLALLYWECLSRIALDHGLADDFHLILLHEIGLKPRKLLTGRAKSKADWRSSAQLQSLTENFAHRITKGGLVIMLNGNRICAA